MGQALSHSEAPPPVVLVPPLFERDLRLRVSSFVTERCHSSRVATVHVLTIMHNFGAACRILHVEV